MRKIHTQSINLSSSKTLPLYRSPRSLEALVRYLSMQGMNRASMLAGSGIEASDLDDPDFLLTPEQEFGVLKNIVKLRPDPGLGLSIGGQFNISIIGKLGAAAISSDTLLDAIEIIFRYGELLQTYYQYCLTVKDDLVYIELNELIDLKDIRLFIYERECAACVRMAGNLAQVPVPLKEIRFVYPKPAHVALYQDFFQCPLVFNAEAFMIVFEKKHLFLPLPMANPLLRKTYEKECRELLQRISGQGTMAGRIHQEMLFRRDSFPGFDQMAHGMNLSPRTLRRRLKEEGTSYQDLASRVRMDKSIRLLQDTDKSIWQITTELGYHDPAHFYRAFKSWTGHPPSYYRKKS